MNTSKPDNPDFYDFEIQPAKTGGVTLLPRGSIVMETASPFFKTVRSALGEYTFDSIAIDLSSIDRLDDYGVVAIYEILRTTGLPDDRVDILNVKTEHWKIFQVTRLDRDTLRVAPPRAAPDAIVQTGEAAINAYQGILYFISFVGAVALSIVRTLKNPRSLRYDDVIRHMKTTGVDALPVVGLISLMLGLIIAFISSMQLQVYGANIYVANLVALAMVSELGPIMTGILVAGRSGSAYAAEISSMKISEEIDALVVMGFDPNRFLVLPRLMAAVIVLPMLTMLSNISAIAGGMLIGLIMLDIPMNAYFHQSIEALTLFELIWGLSKSAVFAVLIAITGCLRGFQATGGAASVGNAATSAVVTSIFLIIFFDSTFAIIRIYWG